MKIIGVISLMFKGIGRRCLYIFLYTPGEEILCFSAFRENRNRGDQKNQPHRFFIFSLLIQEGRTIPNKFRGGQTIFLNEPWPVGPGQFV